MLRVPTEELEGTRGLTTPSDVPVVVRPVSVADIDIENHVIDEALDIEILLDLLVLAIVCQTTVCQIAHRVPRVDVATQYFESGRVFQNVPLCFIAAEIRRGKILFRALVNSVKAPIKAVQIKMEKSSMKRGPAHCIMEIADVLIA